jgi:O-antigen ligase
MKDLMKRYRTGGLVGSVMALLLFSLPFERIPSLDILGGQVTIRINQVVAVMLIVVAVPAILKQRKELLKVPRVFLVAFLFILFLGSLLALDLSAAARVFIATTLTCVTSLAISFVAEERNLENYEKALVWGAWIAVVFGMFQYLGDTFGLSQSVTGLAPNYIKTVFGFPRIQSTALEPLFFASFLLIPFSVLSVRQLIADRTRAVTLFAVTATIVLTVSRGAIAAGILVAVSLLLPTCFYKARSWRKILIYLGLIVAAAAFAYFLTFASSLTTSKTSDDKFSAEKKTKQLVTQTVNFDSQDDRIRNRKLAWQAFKEQPVLGIGPGNFDWYAKEAYPGYQQAPRVIVNNEPLELLAETGLVGFLTLLAFFATLLYSGLKYVLPRFLSGELGNDGGVWATGLIAYLGATAVQYQTFSTLYIMHIWVAIGLLMAIVLGSKSEDASGEKKTKPAKAKN